MHADELHIDAAVVRRLLADQLPQWAQLPLRRSRPRARTAKNRLGDAMLVRLRIRLGRGAGET
ncbi:MAG: hypothetical protein R2838_06595 [Caldilineaceae bacterium]